jgi:hypothetical protein
VDEEFDDVEDYLSRLEEAALEASWEENWINLDPDEDDDDPVFCEVNHFKAAPLTREVLGWDCCLRARKAVIHSSLVNPKKFSAVTSTNQLV